MVYSDHSPRARGGILVYIIWLFWMVGIGYIGVEVTLKNISLYHFGRNEIIMRGEESFFPNCSENLSYNTATTG